MNINDCDVKALVTQLEKLYGIRIENISRDGVGHGINYWVNNRKYLLKLFPQNSKYRIRDEIIACRYLISKGMMVSEHIDTLFGEQIVKLGDFEAHLQKGIGGVCKSQNALNTDETNELINKLLEIIAILRGVKTSPNSLFESPKQVGDIITGIESSIAVESKGYILDLYRDKVSLLLRIPAMNKLPVTLHTSHSDFHVEQVLYRDTRIHAVIDFSHVSQIPIEWEIMRACLKSYDAKNHFDMARMIEHSLSRASRLLPGNTHAENIYTSAIQIVSSEWNIKQYRRTGDNSWLAREQNMLNVFESIIWKI